MRAQTATLVLALALTLGGCGPGSEESTENKVDEDPAASAATTLDDEAEAYVKLVLAVGQHDADDVDADYGDEAPDLGTW